MEAVVEVVVVMEEGEVVLVVDSDFREISFLVEFGW